MSVPTGDTNYTAFFYLLKKKLENKSKSFIYAPISGVDYSRNYFKKSEFKDIGNYLELFAKEWPYIYEVYNKQEEPSIYIVGETYIYGKIKSVYKVILENQVEANHFYKLLKQGKLNKVLVVATGALMSTQSSLQGDSIPGIAHAISIENEVV